MDLFIVSESDSCGESWDSIFSKLLIFVGVRLPDVIFFVCIIPLEIFKSSMGYAFESITSGIFQNKDGGSFIAIFSLKNIGDGSFLIFEIFVFQKISISLSFVPRSLQLCFCRIVSSKESNHESFIFSFDCIFQKIIDLLMGLCIRVLQQ